MRAPSPAEELAAVALAGLATERSGWSPSRKLAVLALLAAGSWAGLAGLVLAAIRAADWEAQVGVLRFIPFI